jgi:IgA Peptidase M64
MRKLVEVDYRTNQVTVLGDWPISEEISSREGEHGLLKRNAEAPVQLMATFRLRTDADGTAPGEPKLASWPVPAQASFYDRPGRKAGQIQGERRARVLIELPDEATDVAFKLRDRGVEAKGAPSDTPLRSPASLESGPLQRDGLISNIIHRPESGGSRPVLGPFDAYAVRLAGSGKWSQSLNIVILGDGFQQGELDVFEACAKALADGIMETSPFSGYDGTKEAPNDKHINIYSLSIASKDSGVDDCPYRGVKKETYFEVEGSFGATDEKGVWAGYFGLSTQNQTVADHAAALLAESFKPACGAAPPVHLKIVLVNTGIYGGHGDFLTRTVFIPIVPDPTLLVNLALHELAHGLCNLTDEYMGEVGLLPGETYANLATESDRRDGNVRWRARAHPFEMIGPNFRAVHQLGDPIDPLTGFPVMNAGLDGMLGLFWGCSFIDTNGDGRTADPYNDPRGACFFRPMAKCKMRWLEEPFCRVCEAEIEAKIRQAAGLPPKS